MTLHGRDNTLQVRNLSIAFQTNRGLRFAGREMSFDHEAGQWISLMGPSGSGKTVLGRAIAGLLTGSPGIVHGAIAFGGMNLLDTLNKFVREVRRDGTVTIQKQVHAWQKRHWHNIRRFARGRFAYIFQNPYDALNPYVAVGRHLEEAFETGGTERSDVREKCMELLARLRLTPPARIIGSYAHELSGGMAQRVVVAMAMAQRASYIIADECTSSLDRESAHATLDLLGNLQQDEGCSILFITHDRSLAGACSRKILMMERGVLAPLNG